MIQRILYFWKNDCEVKDVRWIIMLDDCNYKEGDGIELEVEKYFIETPIFILKK